MGKRSLSVVIVIEVFNREIISDVLIKSELEKRGYNVSLKRKSEDLCLKQCDILITPNGYNTSDYLNYRYRFNCKSGKIINLQWEQLFTRHDEENNYWTSDGQARSMVCLCWGKNRFEQLERAGVHRNNLYIVGPVHTDMMRDGFDRFWKSREEISKEYKLDMDKKWLLFISSLTFAPKRSIYVENTKKLKNYVDFNERHDLESRSQEEILKWFERLLDEDKQIIIVYRPHPTEMESNVLGKIQFRHKGRFRVITDLDIKQWIKVSDILMLWNSTSVIECSMENKKCIILRPFSIRRPNEYILYDDADMVSGYNDFKRKIYDTENIFPVTKNMLSGYYDISSIPSFKRICDVIDKIALDNNYLNPDRMYEINRWKYLIRRFILIKNVIKSIYCFLHRRFGFVIASKAVRDKYFLISWESSIKEREKTKSIEKNMKTIFQ